MDKKILLNNLAEMLAQRNGMTKKKAETFVRSFFDTLETSIIAEKAQKVKGFGTVKIVSVNDRESVNINTGERFQITGHDKISFTPDNNFRDLVNRPFAHFTTVILDDDVDEDELNAIGQIDTPKQPETPELPEQPETPKLPETPETPELPELPETPEQPETQEQPETIAALASLETTEQPETPEEELTDEEANIEDVSTPNEDDMPIIINNNIPETTGHNWWKTAFVILLTAILMVLSYFAGYYRLFCPCKNGPTPPPPAKVEKPMPHDAEGTAPFVAPTDTLSEAKAAQAKAEQEAKEAETAKLKAKETAQKAAADKLAEKETQRQKDLEAAKEFSQLPGSSYLICGIQNTHVMKKGENLYTLAKKTYGDKNFARYIIFFNGLSDPNNVKFGESIQLPKLVKANITHAKSKTRAKAKTKIKK